MQNLIDMTVVKACKELPHVALVQNIPDTNITSWTTPSGNQEPPHTYMDGFLP